MARGVVQPLVVVMLASAALVGASRSLLESCTLPAHSPLQPTITHAPVADLVWAGTEDKYVFAITKRSGEDAGGLWQSSDGAKTWQEKTQHLNDTIKGSEHINVVAVMSQKSDPSKVVVFGSGTYIWTSTDFGVTFTPHQVAGKWHGGHIKSMRPHPRQDSWLLVLVKRPSCAANPDPAAMECPHDLLLTQDLYGALTWKNLTDNASNGIAGFVDFDWGASLCARSACPTCEQPKDLACPKETITPDETIYATMYERAGAYDQAWDPDVHFVTSHTWFSEFTIRMRCGNMFELVGHSIYVAFANSCPTDGDGRKRTDTNFKGISLYTSIDAGAHFVQACLPLQMKQDGYGLVETHDGSGAVIVVNYVTSMGFMDVQASSIYTAGPHHALFSLSLQNVADADFGTSTDFAKIEGLPGIYIANQFNMMAMPDAGEYPYGDEGFGEPVIETRITFNGGGSWQKIPAPSNILNAKCNRCNGQGPDACFLHLHGMTAWEYRDARSAMPAVYSNPSAPGFIMATGNVAPLGQGLDDNDGLCTWLSTDGGVTWSDVIAGAYIYEFADWGGVIVMAKFPGKSGEVAEEVLFSMDYGKCWHRVPLDKALLVDNIRIEPDGQRPRVVLHGRACRKSASAKCMYSDDDTRSQTEGVMYLLDVPDAMSGKGVGLCAYNDYEQFDIPVSPRNGAARCVLGDKVQIQRRRPAAECLNGGDYKRPPAVRTPCDCTTEDIECDYGFTRRGADCIPLERSRLPTCPVLDQRIYTVSSTGKRLIHGDTCNNVKAVIPDTDGKGGATGKGGGGGGPSGGGGSPSGGGKKKHGALFKFMMTLLIFFVLAGLFVAWWVYLAKEEHRDMVRDSCVAAVGFLAGLYAMARDKIRGTRVVAQEQDLGYFQPLGDSGGNDAEERGIFTLR